MTEKHYGGASSHGLKKDINKTSSQTAGVDNKKKADEITKANAEEKVMNRGRHDEIEGYNDYVKAGKIASEIVKYAKSIIKLGVKLLEIAEKIDSKILELRAKPAFPVNLSINEIAAHDTPSFNDERTASGLLKVDIGVQIDGCTADTSFSVDLENNEENKKLIQAAESGLKAAIEKINLGVQTSEIGKAIENAIKSFNFVPIHNLSGHLIEKYDLHAGITIPNYDNSQEIQIESGVYAIEPFSTDGLGNVRDGKPSGIYRLDKPGSVRDNFAREVLSFIVEEYQSLPFCSRWIYKKFSSRGLLALRQIEAAGILHQYPQLVESGKGKVAQAEHTVIITKKDKVVTTLYSN